MYSQRQCQTICPALLTVSDLKLLHLKNRLHYTVFCSGFAVFRVHSSQCFLFTGFLCSNLSARTCKSKPCNVSLDSEERATKKITVSHHLTQPKTVLLHLFHGTLTFLIGNLGTVLSTSAILFSLVPLRDFRTSRILSNSLSSRVSKMCGKFTLPCSSFNSKFSCLVLVALGHDIAGTPHQLSHHIFILQETFLPATIHA